MTRLHTHYDNLKVSRDAPLEVIRASYKALAQKYHPDKNDGDPEAGRITAAINVAYEKLSNPKLRRAHDEWIAEQELLAASVHRPTVEQASAADVPQPTPAPVAPPTTRSAWVGRQRGAPDRAENSGGRSLGASVARYWPAYALIGFLVWVWSQETSSPAEQSGERHSDSLADFSRPPAAPNGQPWPSVPSYVAGYKRLNRNGLSSVTIDNTRLDSDMFVKLVTLDTFPPVPVRTFFIPAGASFKAGKITPGRYDVRYRNLQSGDLSRSEPFTLTETTGLDGSNFSNITMTLYKVRDGNMKTYGLREADF